MQKREIFTLGKSDVEFVQGPLDQLLVADAEATRVFARIVLEMVLVISGVRSGKDLTILEDEDGDLVTVRVDEGLGLQPVLEMKLYRGGRATGGWLTTALRLADQLAETRRQAILEELESGVSTN